MEAELASGFWSGLLNFGGVGMLAAAALWGLWKLDKRNTARTDQLITEIKADREAHVAMNRVLVEQVAARVEAVFNKLDSCPGRKQP